MLNTQGKPFVAGGIDIVDELKKTAFGVEATNRARGDRTNKDANKTEKVYYDVKTLPKLLEKVATRAALAKPASKTDAEIGDVGDNKIAIPFDDATNEYICGSLDTDWEKMNMQLSGMDKESLWGSELIMGTILDSKRQADTDTESQKDTKINLVNQLSTVSSTSSTEPQKQPPSLKSVKKSLPSTPPLPPVPPSSPEDSSQVPALVPSSPVIFPSLLFQGFKTATESNLSTDGQVENRKEMEVDGLMNGRLPFYTNLTEGTMFDVVEMPVKTTVEHFQHEWSAPTVNDYSSIRLLQLKKELDLKDLECPELTSGTYLETMSTSTPENTSIWETPSEANLLTRSDVSLHGESDE